MRHFLIILFALASLAGHCFAAGDQPAGGGDSATQPTEPAPGDSAGKKESEKKKGDKKKSAGGEEEPDCE